VILHGKTQKKRLKQLPKRDKTKDLKVPSALRKIPIFKLKSETELFNSTKFMKLSVKKKG